MSKHTPTTLDFQGHPIRIVDHLVPVNDIADTLGRDRQAMTRLIDRDPVLAGMKGGVVMATPGGDQVSLCLPYEGVIRIWPEWFANLPGERPKGPQEVVTPTLELTQPMRLELRQVEA